MLFLGGATLGVWGTCSRSEGPVSSVGRVCAVKQIQSLRPSLASRWGYKHRLVLVAGVGVRLGKWGWPYV